MQKLKNAWIYQWCIQNPVEHLQWSLFAKMVNRFQPLTVVNFKRINGTDLLELEIYTAQKMKFSIKDCFSKYDQVRVSITEVGNIVDS